MKYFMRHGLRVLAVLAVATVATRTGAVAQTPTPEGTRIRNIATVTFTDANSNAYLAVADTVDVMVGFAAGVDATGAASAAPDPGATDTLTFTITNIGNGTDIVSVSGAISLVGLMTVTGYSYNGTVYPDLAALNLALSGDSIPAGGAITVLVLYDVAAGAGGASADYTLTATSGRSGTTSDAQTTTVAPTETLGVAVTPDSPPELQQLPTGSAPAYQFTFTVTNSGNGAEDFNLVASNPGTAITIVSVNGVSGTTATLSGLAAGASAPVVVTYTIAAAAAAGTADTVYLSATTQSPPATSDNGFVPVKVIKAALTMLKQAWLGDRSGAITGDVLPGDFIEYRVEVTNSGEAAAANVVVTDALPGPVAFVATDDPGGSWATISEAGGTVTATLAGSLAPGASAYFWIRVQVR